MSAEETEKKVDEQTKVPEPETEKKEQHEPEPPRITNDDVETDQVRKVVNKKPSTMSKETKEGEKTEKEY